jgi:hypothetical protein
MASKINPSTLRKRQVNFPEEVTMNPSSDNMEDLSSKKSQGGTSTKLVPSQSRTLSRMWNRFLQAYSVFVSNSLNQDKLLKMVQYSLWMLSRFYVGNNNTTAREALAKLAGELSWARYATRLLGLPTALEGVQSGTWASSKSLGKAMAWTMVLYYPLEHLAYLKWKAPQWIGTRTPSFVSKKTYITAESRPTRLAERASAWSCRFWLAFIALDIVRSTLALNPKATRLPPSSDDASSTTTELVSLPVAVSSDTKRNERLLLIRNSLFVLPMIHWSLPNWDTQPWLSETTCNSILWLEALVCMYQGIQNIPGEPKSTCCED